MHDENLTHDEQYYGYGCCHIFAIAALEFFEEHGIGGHFLVVCDPEELYYEGEDSDDDVAAVLHVYAVIETRGGSKAIDIFGMHPDEQATDLAKNRYGAFTTEEERVPDRETLIDYFVQQDDDEDDYKPLSSFEDGDIEEAKEIVKAAYLALIEDLRPSTSNTMGS